jgi:hypothetical protein
VDCATRERQSWLAAIAIIAALSIAGCESTIVGSEVEGTDRRHVDGANLDLLDPGDYPTTAVPLTVADGTGVVLEGQRMADAVVDPSDVDAALRHLRPFNTGAVQNAEALRGVLGLSRVGILRSHNLIAGFASSRDSEGGSSPSTSLVNLVMRFPDGLGASATAAALAATNAAQVPMAIPRHSDAVASAYDMGHGVIVESFAPHGPYVLYQWVQTKESVETATGLVARTLDLQGPQIDHFVPTDSSRLASLSFDTDGLVAHTLPAEIEVFSATAGEYSARGTLHFQTDPVASAALFMRAGVESVSLRESVVLQTRDPAAAARLVDELAGHAAATGATEISGVPGLPNAICVDVDMAANRTSSRFHCHAFAGRYAFETSSEHQDDAREKTVAQYLILRQYR